MTSDEQISILRAMVGTDEAESVLASFLSLAGSKIINRAYPFNQNISTVPERYRSLQVEIAAYMMNKRGAEGQTGHIRERRCARGHAVRRNAIRGGDIPCRISGVTSAPFGTRYTRGVKSWRTLTAILAA